MKKDSFEEWFHKFYYSDDAQSYVFSNYNNATRDEQVGEFSAKAAWNHQQEKIDGLFFKNEVFKEANAQLADKIKLIDALKRSTEKELEQIKEENQLLKGLVNDKDIELSEIYEWMCDSSDREASFDEWAKE